MRDCGGTGWGAGVSWPRRRCCCGRLGQHRGGALGPCPTLLCSPGPCLEPHLAPAGSPQVPVFPVPSGRAGSAAGMGWGLACPDGSSGWGWVCQEARHLRLRRRGPHQDTEAPRKQAQRAPGRKESVA